MPGAERNLSIELLADHTGFVDRLAQWYEREWAPYYGPQGDATTGQVPSIVGLLVAPDHRYSGVAGALLDFAEALARDLGHDELFMSTTILGEHLKRRGWKEQGDVEFFNNERGKMYACALTVNRSS